MPPRSLLPPKLRSRAPHRAAVAAPLADDRLAGADAIAAYIGLTAKQVYKMVERNRRHPGSAPPIFHDGTGLVARKSAIEAWYLERERATQGGR